MRELRRVIFVHTRQNRQPLVFRDQGRADGGCHRAERCDTRQEAQHNIGTQRSNPLVQWRKRAIQHGITEQSIDRTNTWLHPFGDCSCRGIPGCRRLDLLALHHKRQRNDLLTAGLKIGLTNVESEALLFGPPPGYENDIGLAQCLSAGNGYKTWIPRAKTDDGELCSVHQTSTSISSGCPALTIYTGLSAAK